MQNYPHEKFARSQLWRDDVGVACRDELRILIQNGTRPAGIYSYFRDNCQLSRTRILDLLKQSGVTIPVPESVDEISDDRRRRLVELSLSD